MNDTEVAAGQWDEAIELSRLVVGHSDLDKEERSYKEGMARKLAHARELAERADSEWPQALRRGLAVRHGPVSQFVLMALDRWVRAESESLRVALLALWQARDPVEALGPFVDAARPRDKAFSPGNVLTLGTTLLSAVDPAIYPPYRTRAANAFLGGVGIGRVPVGDVVARVRQYYDVLDLFVDHAQTAGIGLRDRLDAQGLVWTLVGGALPDDWPEELRSALLDWRGDSDPDEVEGPAIGDRAWAVRPKPGGKDLIATWLREAYVSLSATHLGNVAPDSTKAVVRSVIDDRYDHVDYAQRIGLTEDYFAFLSRMNDGDVVVARHDDQIWLGRVSGPPEFHDVEPRLRRVVEWQSAPVSVGALPAPVPSLLATPSRTVIDLTDARDALDKLFPEAVDVDLDVVDEPEATVASSGPLLLRRADDALVRETVTDAGWLNEYIGLLESRRQVIVHGPPGTGKTFLARKVARHVAGDEQVQLVQFHPSYAYEDFFEGFRPRAQADGSLTFDKVPGPLRRIASDAASNPGTPYVLIIDEINRGNLAKVFGELYFLLEYREENVTLQYSPETPFTLPKNLFVIGTMNTADRSIAMVDAAIRRRFSFIEMHPEVEPVAGLLGRWLAANQKDEVRAGLLAALNREIGEEDRDFKIGPSYLMRDEAGMDEGLERVWRHDIMPLLEEHYYGRLTREQVAAQFGLDALRRRLVAPGPVDGEAGPGEAEPPSDV